MQYPFNISIRTPIFWCKPRRERKKIRKSDQSDPSSWSDGRIWGVSNQDHSISKGTPTDNFFLSWTSISSATLKMRPWGKISSAKSVLRKITRSAMLCGSVAWPRLARTRGRGAGGCCAAATAPCAGCPWKTWKEKERDEKAELPSEAEEEKTGSGAVDLWRRLRRVGADEGEVIRWRRRRRRVPVRRERATQPCRLHFLAKTAGGEHLSSRRRRKDKNDGRKEGESPPWHSPPWTRRKLSPQPGLHGSAGRHRRRRSCRSRRRRPSPGRGWDPAGKSLRRATRRRRRSPPGRLLQRRRRRRTRAWRISARRSRPRCPPAAGARPCWLTSDRTKSEKTTTEQLQHSPPSPYAGIELAAGKQGSPRQAHRELERES